MKMSKLDSEELEILEAFEKGELRRAIHATQEIEMHRAMAEAAFKKDVRVSIRLSTRDVRALQARALQEGIPYITLISSIVHKFADGRLVEKAENK
jgi:predicted DNA binding CopG/RHH family protein